MPQKEEMEKVNRRILEVQTENVVLRREVETLKARMKSNFDDMKQILEIQQKTIEFLTNAYGKAKRKA
jgi:hypothetical protein